MRSAPQGNSLALATHFAETALAVVAPRAREQYAGLVPDPVYSLELTRLQKSFAWQRMTYFEAALLDETNGNCSEGVSEWVKVKHL